MCSREQYEAFFREADASGDGIVTKEEMYKILGPRMQYNEYQMEKFFKSADLSNDKKVSMEEFLTAMGCLPEADHKQAMFRRAFNEFDVDGSGSIDAKELKAVLAEVEPNCDEQQLERIRKTFDENGDGKFDYVEFCKRFFNQ